jgi:hypothetical protein
LSSCIFINDGKGNFEMRRLPNEAQFSPIMGMIVEDVNGDGKLDLVAAGNKYGAEVETVRYDAGRGVCLLGDGKGGFIAMPPKKSGFFANGNLKSLARIKIGNRAAYLTGINNGKLKFFMR